MVRRPSVASLDSGTESSEYGDEAPVIAGYDAPAAKPSWSGSGGRWLVWPMRVVLWAAIPVIGYRGVMAILLDETPVVTNHKGTSLASSGPRFPVTVGSAYALQFGQVYLNFSLSGELRGAAQLTAFIPANVRALQLKFGWNGTGTWTRGSEQVAGIDARNAHAAVVMVLDTPNWHLIELGVPPHLSCSQLVVSGESDWLPAPSAASPPQAASSDPAPQSAPSSQMPGFFQAYASGDQATLNRFLARVTWVGGLGGAVGFGSIASLTVLRGGTTRDITMTVNWMLYGQVSPPAPQLAATYDVSVIDQPGGKRYVREIPASTQPMGTQRTGSRHAVRCTEERRRSGEHRSLLGPQINDSAVATFECTGLRPALSYRSLRRLDVARASASSRHGVIVAPSETSLKWRPACHVVGKARPNPARGRAQARSGSA